MIGKPIHFTNLNTHSGGFASDSALLPSFARSSLTRWGFALIAVLCCLLQGRAGDFLYFSERAKQEPFWYRLMRIGTDGSGLQKVIEGENEFIQGGIAFDIANGHLYSGGGTWLFRANLDGSDRVDLVHTSGGRCVQAVELDLVHGKVYWSEAGNFTHALLCANLDGSDMHTFFEGGWNASGFNGLAVDPVGGKLYANYDVNFDGNDRILVMNLDGTEQKVLYDLGGPAADPFELEIDLATDTLYFNSNTQGGIFRVAADGSSAVDLVLATPEGCSNFHYDPVDHRFYFINYLLQNGSRDERSWIRSANLDGTDLRTVVESSEVMYWIEVAHSMSQLVLSDEHVTVHYRDKDAPGATEQNKGYSRAEIRGQVDFCDWGKMSDDILSGTGANQVSVGVRVILGGIAIADNIVSLQVRGGNRENWESEPNGSSPVEALKIHWQNALKFNSKDSNPLSPKIESKFIGLDSTDLRYEAKSGTYTTTLPNGVFVSVADGKITSVSGLADTAYEVAKDQKQVELTVPYRLVPGMAVATAGTLNDTITITPDVNYTAAEAKFQLKLGADGLTAIPLFSEGTGTLQYEITLGTGAGEHPAFGRSIIGIGSKLWDKNEANDKRFKDNTLD